MIINSTMILILFFVIFKDVNHPNKGFKIYFIIVIVIRNIFAYIIS